MTNINFNPYNRDYLSKLASREIKPTLEVLNSLDWKQVSKTLQNPTDYVYLLNTKSVLQQEADKIQQATEAEAQKVSAMNPLRRVVYKAIEKPVANYMQQFKKPPEIPIQFRKESSRNYYPWGGD